ncbi:hypothetical protein FSP39_016638 [Pinctada imbricata]|uniref:Reelin domain-containing protein n=1 Tax=Pinctada imbricata TaxID=66713 RepID=A0AA88Y4Y3_PINIB|nr:hypothetical protein FSP39_016638 [Pinctada imbricata]
MCPLGTFDTTSARFFQPSNCSHLVLKNTRGAEHTFAFGWTAPECGCVTIRARVKTSDTNAYILDDNDVSDGYLTKRVCRQNLKDILSHISPNEKEDILCQVSQNLQIGSLDQRPDIMSRRKLQYDNLSSLEKQTLDMALHQRLRSVNMCCGLRGEERHECLGDVRRRRLDHFCAYGEPLIPFTTDRVDYMMERKKECCWRLGERRYHCFGNIPQGDGVHSNAVWRVKNMRHKDDSDPLNDLEDFPVETLRQLPLQQAKVASKISRKSMPSIRNRALAGSVVQKKPKSIPGYTLTIPPKPVTRKNDVETTTAVVTMDTTKTTKHLLRKIKRYQTRLECCNQGKFYATKLMGDPWQMCSDEAYTYARTIRGGRRKCRAFYLRCCMEEYQR